MRTGRLAALAFSLAAGAALAAPTADSPGPMSRPAALAAGAAASDAASDVVRPRPRTAAGEPEVMRAALGAGFVFTAPANLPVLRPARRPAQAAVAEAPMPTAAPEASPRPEARRMALRTPSRARAIAGGPEVLLQAAFRAPQATGPATSRKGTVCGDPAIKGKTIPPILGKVKGCGLDEAVSVTSVAGVALSQPASIDCATARSLKDWVEGGVKPAVGRRGGGVAALQVAASYSCRPRNNQKGAKISEHGRGRAVDISAILLADGTAVTVARGWGSKGFGKTLASMRKAACGPFNTVLGPGSDPFHGDHFHLDTAHGRGPYCR